MKLIEDLGAEVIRVPPKVHYVHNAIYECPKCLKHFTCSMANVRNGHTTKCRSCANITRGDKKAKKAEGAFISTCNALHNYKYDYSLTVYAGDATPVIIICPIHGQFQQSPTHHKRDTGCPTCSAQRRAKLKSEKAKQTFASTGNAVHNHKYDYSLVDYINNTENVQIICPLHAAFWQQPNNHKQGKGCPQCAKFGFNKNKPGILYYLKVQYENVINYKIGITNLSVEKRFNNLDLSRIVILQITNYENGEDAYIEEQRILKEFKHIRYTGEPILSSGNTELFTEDILNLDKG